MLVVKVGGPAYHIAIPHRSTTSLYHIALPHRYTTSVWAAPARRGDLPRGGQQRVGGDVPDEQQQVRVDAALHEGVARERARVLLVQPRPRLLEELREPAPEGDAAGRADGGVAGGLLEPRARGEPGEGVPHQRLLDAGQGVPGAERERVPGGERAGRPRVPDDGDGRRDGLRDRGEHDLRDGGGGPEDVLPVLDADGGRRQGGGRLPRVRGERLRRGAHGGQHRLGGGRQDEGAVPAGRGLCGERHGGVGGERRVVRGAEPGGRDAQAGGRGGVLRGGEHEHAERGQGVPPVLQVHERGLERVPGAGAESEALRGRERREPGQRERVRGEPAEGLLPGRRERRERLLDAGQGASGAERPGLRRRERVRVHGGRGGGPLPVHP